MKHPRTKHRVACFTLVRRDPLGWSKVRRPCRAELTLIVQLVRFCSRVAGRVVWQGYVRTLGFRGDGLAVAGAVSAFSVFRLRESEIIGAVPF